jgi:type 1 glutamine amidotransferase
MIRAAILASLLLPVTLLAQDAKPKKIVILAGPKSHGPVGNGIHDYGWSARLLKVMLDNSNIKDRIRVETHLDGWPRDPRTLEDADAIMVISDSRDGDQYAEAPHLASPERVRFMEKQIKRGCGFLTFHFSTFAPNQYAKQMLDWSGGFFQWETDGKKQWYSAITTKDAEVRVASPQHPISRGLKPFSMKEEFYYNIRFSDKDERLKPIWVVPALPGREPDGRVVAWAREREDGGRGFGTTCGHFYENWKHPEFRTLILNALCWAAKVDVPKGGVEARFFTHEEIMRQLDPPIRVLLFAGNDAHKWHNWEKTTPAIKAALQKDTRIRVDVSNDIEDLGRRKLGDYHVIVQNYANWLDPKQLSDESKNAFVEYLKNGGGLVLIHFANGAWHFSLPNAKESDWPEYRKIVRRVWNHNSNPPSGHDAFGLFIVEPTKAKHAITDGLKPFEMTDELYFRQDGTEKIEPLITARSRITKQDEPLAWVYNYGKGRIFQTLLGHSEKTYEAYEAREMLRRGVAWCADRDVRALERDKDAPPRPSSTK